MIDTARPDFEALAAKEREFFEFDRQLIGHTPTIALTPTVDGRTGAYEENVERTWEMVRKVYNLIDSNVRLPGNRKVRLVVAPEIVYGPRSGAVAQAYYSTQGVCANIWISRSWCYSDELMSACSGIGSSEWLHAAYGLNQTDRPGAVWLKAFCAAMDEKKKPIFSIYNPDLENEESPICDYVSGRLLRFARCAATVGEMRGKNYMSLGSVSMGIIGSDVRRNIMSDYLGMGSVSVDMVALQGRMDRGLYDREEVDKAFNFFKSNFAFDYGEGQRPMPNDTLLRECCKMAVIVKDLMTGNPRLADKAVGDAQGFRADVEYAQGSNAIAAGTQGQRQWTDLYPNFDLVESILCSSFDWGGFGDTRIIATENDSKNGVGMLMAHLLTGGVPQMFADIRTNWTPESIENATGIDVRDVCPRGLIDKRNSGAAALDYAVDIFGLVPGGESMSVQKVWSAICDSPELQKKLQETACGKTTYMGADLTYFPGDGLSSSYCCPGGVPMTAYRLNVVGDLLTASVVEGETVELPEAVIKHISECTNPTWPEGYWTPFGMTSFEYMSKIGPNHDGNSFGLIGADFITLCAMLRIPVDMHNIDEKDVFRPTMWDRFGGDDFRACEFLGPLFD